VRNIYETVEPQRTGWGDHTFRLPETAYRWWELEEEMTGANMESEWVKIGYGPVALVDDFDVLLQAPDLIF
jgi:hypothetical protein